MSVELPPPTRAACEQDACEERHLRDVETDALVELMEGYRSAAFAALFDHPELRETIPVVFEHDYATLDEPQLTGVWEAPPGGARLTWAPIPVEVFGRILIRCRPGTDAPTEEDTLLATIEDPEQTSYLATGMYTPLLGTFAFRIWLTDVHEHQAASDPVTVTRPA